MLIQRMCEAKSTVKSGVWSRSRAPIAGLGLLAALGLSACGAAELKGQSPAEPGQVAVAPAPPTQTVIVNASSPRAFVGHFLAGSRLHFAVADTLWTNAPSDTLHGAAGVPGATCQSDVHHGCVAPGAPLMGLILLTIASDQRDPATVGKTACVPSRQLYIPSGVELPIPFYSEMALTPNDWADGLDNNSGAIEVAVEQSNGREAPTIERKQITVDARDAPTPIGRFVKGEYLKISVLGGTWTNDPEVPRVSSAGSAVLACGALGHTCMGPNALPRMGLVLLLSACVTPATGSLARPLTERTHLPVDTDVTLVRDSDFYLAPNDWEDSLSDNSGSARVEVRLVPP